MKTKAPLPWKFVANSWQHTTIYDAAGDIVCRLDLEDWDVTEENQDALEALQESVARSIVDAANGGGKSPTVVPQ